LEASDCTFVSVFLADWSTRLLQLGSALDPGGGTVQFPTEGATSSVLSEAFFLAMCFNHYCLFVCFIPSDRFYG
jgi:hypothetical protein